MKRGKGDPWKRLLLVVVVAVVVGGWGVAHKGRQRISRSKVIHKKESGD